jgi:putative intracellular protease/amidase
MKRHGLRFAACLLVGLLAGLSGLSAPATAAPITVGILLLNKPYITEFAGPLDVYHHVPADKLKVFIISDTDQELVTYEGMPFRANYTIDNAPRLDVLVVPSGAGSLDADLKNERVINWLKKVAPEAKFITSHCEGAFLLGQAGLLADKEATTFPADIDALQTRYPACRVQKGKRTAYRQTHKNSLTRAVSADPRHVCPGGHAPRLSHQRGSCRSRGAHPAR